MINLFIQQLASEFAYIWLNEYFTLYHRFTEPQTFVAPYVKAVYELFTFLYLLKICQFKAQLLNNISLIPFLFVDSAI